MLVDYVRVYQATTVTATTPVITPGQRGECGVLPGDRGAGRLAVLYGTNLADGTYPVRDIDR
jgi:hypothetical protein